MTTNRLFRIAVLAATAWAVGLAGCHPAVTSAPSAEGAPPAGGDPAPVWTVLEPIKARSTGGTTLTKQPDGSILASGKHPSPDTYTITAHTTLTGITAVRLEMLPDASLGGRGPGRAPHGNFVLNEIRLTVAPLEDKGTAVPVRFHKAAADYSQPGYGVAGAIDGNPDTAWAVDPFYGKRHGAVFEAKAPFGFPRGTALTFTLDQSTRVPSHGLGRFRLSVTTAQPPVPLELLELSPRDLAAAWSDLAAADATRAQLAVEALVLSRQAVGFLRGRLKPEPVRADTRRIARLIKELDDNKFAVRERASAELEKLGPAAAPALARVLLGEASPEARRRAERLLAKVRGAPSLVRAQRGVEVLVRLGTADARRLLEDLAEGPPDAWLTQEARSGRQRLRKGGVP
jgi:hypothetical protein